MTKSATIILLFFSSCLCQFVMDFGMKPDVTFGENNERFDVESIIQDQSRMDVVNPIDDYRRHAKDKGQSETENNVKYERGNEKEVGKEEELFDALKDAVKSFDIKDFAHHSKIDSSSNDEDYEKNLKAFDIRRSLRERLDHLHKGVKNRRGMPPDPEDEILFQYGVPVNMKVEGFLEVPLGER